MIKVIGSIIPPFSNPCAFQDISNVSGIPISKCQFPGLKVEYLNIIQESGVLTFELIHQTALGHGILSKNSTWTRDFGKILSGSLDSAVPYVTITPERSRYFDFR